MIKAITSVPVVRKALTGTMLVASLLGGAASCSRPAKTTGETNVSYTQIMEKDGTDVFESGAKNSKAVPANKKEIDQVSYETNKYQEARTYTDSTNFKTYGLYYGSIYTQAKSDDWMGYVTKPYYKEADEYMRLNLYKACDSVTKILNAKDSEINKATRTYRTNLLEKYSRNLYENKDGVPTAKECSDYLDRTLAGLDISTEDYNKCLEKIDNFKKAQGEEDNQKFAEYLAYKQFLIDSINIRAILRDLGYLKDPIMKHEFETQAADLRPEPFLIQE